MWIAQQSKLRPGAVDKEEATYDTMTLRELRTCADGTSLKRKRSYCRIPPRRPTAAAAALAWPTLTPDSSRAGSWSRAVLRCAGEGCSVLLIDVGTVVGHCMAVIQHDMT